jgi:hypothetical protein
MEAPGVEPHQAHAGNINDDALLARMRLELLGIFRTGSVRAVPARGATWCAVTAQQRHMRAPRVSSTRARYPERRVSRAAARAERAGGSWLTTAAGAY